MEDNSLILDSDGMPRPRAPQKDYYIFATKIGACITALCNNRSPMMPRAVLGIGGVDTIHIPMKVI